MPANTATRIGSTFWSLIVLASIVAVDSVALYAFWGWFAVPAFGARAISVPLAVGLVLLFRDFVRPSVTEANHGSIPEAIGDLIGGYLAGPLILIAAGWLVHLLL